MPSLLTESFTSLHNPLDVAEQAVIDRDMPYERLSDQELVAEVQGEWCNYRIWLSWQEELSSVMITCALDTKIAPTMRSKIYPLIGMVNEKLWLGHFDLSSEDGTIAFRHTIMLKGAESATIEQMDEVLAVALCECGRFYPAFQSVLWGGKNTEEALSIAVFDTVGEA